MPTERRPPFLFPGATSQQRLKGLFSPDWEATPQSVKGSLTSGSERSLAVGRLEDVSRSGEEREEGERQEESRGPGKPGRASTFFPVPQTSPSSSVTQASPRATWVLISSVDVRHSSPAMEEEWTALHRSKKHPTNAGQAPLPNPSATPIFCCWNCNTVPETLTPQSPYQAGWGALTRRTPAGTSRVRIKIDLQDD